MAETTLQLASSNSRRPVIELLLLAGPTVGQMASYTLMQFIDVWMLARVGPGILAATAASNAGILAFSVISIGFGTLLVVNTLVSQSFGRKDHAACGRYLWQGVWLAAIYAVLLLPVIPFVPMLFAHVGHEPRLVRLESDYLQIVLAGSVFKLVGTAFSQFLLAINRPWLVLAATGFGVGINAFVAWVLIFGHFGFVPMGVKGSAFAQNVGVCFEMLAAIGFASLPAIRRVFHVGDWRFRASMFRTLLKVGIPSGIQTASEVLAWSMFLIWVMAPLGTNVMAANTFMLRYMTLSFMPAFGISIAVTALVGRYLGMGRLDLARRRADIAFVVASSYMIACGIFFFLGRYTLIGLFTHDPEVLRAGAVLMVVAAIYQFFDAMYIIYNGALRGAGDTFIPATVTASLCWGVCVVGGWSIARSHPQWGPLGPWTAGMIYGLILGLFMLTRFRRGQWKAIVDRDGDADKVIEPSQSGEPSAKLSRFDAAAS